MSAISTPLSTLPCFQQHTFTPFKEATLSKFLRITAVVLGSLLCIVGVLLFSKVIGVNSISVGYGLFATGITLCALGTLIQCSDRIFCKQIRRSESQWGVTEEENAALKYIAKHPLIRAGGYIGTEILSANKCMLAQQPESFKSAERFGQGTHCKQHTNAREFLEEVVQANSPLQTIIQAYEKQPDREDTALTLKKWVEKTRKALKAD